VAPARKSKSKEVGATEGAPKGNPGQTPSDELESRVEVTETLLARGMRKSDIKRYLRTEYGVTARTCENYLSRAKDRIMLKLREDRESHRSMSLALYRSVLSDANASLADRLRAQRDIDRLLGLNAPLKVAATDTHGRDLPPHEARDTISALAQRIADRMGGSGAS